MRTAMPLLGALLLSLPLPACQAPAAPQGMGVGAVFDRVQSAVVTLRTTGRTISSDARLGQVALEGVGSGVMVSADGKILTAAHVVQTADSVTVEFSDGSTRPARVVSSNPDADVAMVMLEQAAPEWVTPAVLGDSDEVRVGDVAFVVGAPLGVTHSLTVGHISARRASTEKLQGIVRVQQFQTDAAINQGNSGGPLFDMDGEVIGIVSYIVSQTGGDQGLGFAVTSNVARTLMLEQPAFWSGVDGVMLNETLAGLFNVPNKQVGMLVQNVAGHSPAADIGLRGGTVVATIYDEEILIGGDIVLAVLGTPVGAKDAFQTISNALGALPVNGELSVKVLRGGELMELKGNMKSRR